MKAKRVVLGLVLLGAVGVKAEAEFRDTDMQMEVPAQPAKRDEWTVYKEGHSLVMVIKHAASGKDRYTKLRLDDLNEYVDRAQQEEDILNFVNQGDFLPKGTKLISLIPEGKGDVCNVSESEVGADDEKYNYVVVLMPAPFRDKYFLVMLDGCYKVKAAIVVPNS